MKNPSEQAQIFKEYFKAIRDTRLSAWGDQKHAVTKPFGMEIMCAVFPAVKLRVDLNDSRQYTANSFVKALEPLKGMAIKVPGAGDDAAIPLTWEAGPLGPLSNAAGRALIIRQMRDRLVAADEESGRGIGRNL